MRPMRLELEGFTSFREKCEIDFSRLGLFAITGRTGAGKTSLLDAMTYALYGRTTRLNKAVKGLVSQGASGMSVSLCFRAGKDEYRVSRALRQSAATARLEKLEQGRWRSLSGSAADIGDRVARIIGLDFEAFSRTVILPQGRFDQFLRGSRKEQRETLDDLLDMRIYQRMTQLANTKKNLAGELAAAKLAEIDASATAGARAEEEREIARLMAEEERAADTVDRLRRAFPGALALAEERKTRQALANELRAMQTKLAEAEAAAHSAQRDLDGRRARAETLERDLAALDYDGEAHIRWARLEQAAVRRRDLGEQLAAHERRRSAEERKLRDAEKTVAIAAETLAAASRQLRDAEQLRTSAKAAFDELRARHGSADAIQHVCRDMENAHSAGGELPRLREGIARLETRLAALEAGCEASAQAAAQAEAELESWRANYERWLARDRVAVLRQGLKPGEPCPVCEQMVHSPPAPIDTKELERARARRDAAEVELRRRRDALAAARAEAGGLPDRIEAARRERALRESAMEAAVARASRILGAAVGEDAATPLEALAAKIRAAESAAGEAQAGYERSAASETRASRAFQEAVNRQNLAASQTANIDAVTAALNAEMASLEEALEGAPPLAEISARLAACEQARRKFAEFEAARSRHANEVREAEARAVRCAGDVEALRDAQSKCAAAIRELDREIAGLEEQLRGRLGGMETPAAGDEAGQLGGIQDAAQKDLEAVRSRVERRRWAIQAIDEKMARNQRLREEIAQHNAEEAQYRDLATWLNAANFQQYLMSSAFELLAYEGSRHLKDLSSGRYAFAYDEAEFKVIDTWNGGDSRSVNTLSGGESFLASLALALALAESIAELDPEGGAVALESLFLDEGFSALDAETQSRVADAMQVLQGSKRLIGVITHVQALADLMPARIEIERTLSGSRARQIAG